MARSADRPAPEIRLATLSTTQEARALALGYTEQPSLLVAFPYLGMFQKRRTDYRIRSWVLDSGAFTAHHAGTEINLQEYADTCKHHMATDPLLVEVFALDVIGDWKASLKNTEAMWAQGVPAIPCYHINEPVDVLLSLARDYPKIALGGVARMRGDAKMQFARQCFARVWPKKIHGFGFGSEAAVLGLPFHTTDASNWELGPSCFGQWISFGGKKVSVRGSKQNLAPEIEWYLKLERRARTHWKKEMDLLASMDAQEVAT